jgi:hypothetical protein
MVMMIVIFCVKNNPTLKKKLTLEIFKNFYFFSISGYVPKMALAIYMRSDKKKVEKKRNEIDENRSKNISFMTQAQEKVLSCVSN